MGKQKSFIIVGTSFAALIILILLFSLVIKGIKKTSFKFEASKYVVEIGKSKALGPTIYAGGEVKGNIELEYIVDKEGIIEIKQGTYAIGSTNVYCWCFVETNSQGQTVEKETNIPYNEKDEITIENGYWFINGENTNVKAENNYSGEELESHITRTVEPKSVNCYILNGNQTTIPYSNKDVLTRDETSGNWFINGEDTGYTYKGIHITILGVEEGTINLTAKGVIDGEEQSATTTIQICKPNPQSLNVKYIDNTVFVAVDEQFKLDNYSVIAKEGAITEPVQDVTYSFVGNKDGIINENNVFKATKEGTYRIKLTIPESSFTVGLGQINTISSTVIVIVINSSKENVEKIEKARLAISEIGMVENTEECRNLVASTRNDVNAALTGIGIDLNDSDAVSKYITNIDKLKAAEKRIENFDMN